MITNYSIDSNKRHTYLFLNVCVYVYVFKFIDSILNFRQFEKKHHIYMTAKYVD